MSLPETFNSRIFTLPESQLIDIQWGGLSQLKAELLVLEFAILKGNYEYFHLLSGQDLPIKSQDYIHDYMNHVAAGRNCISCEHGDNVDRIHYHNCGYYHLFVEKIRSRNIVVRKMCSFLRNSFISMQKIAGYHRDWTGYTLGKGTNWGSFNQEFVQYLVNNRRVIVQLFTGVLGPDEIYKQTMILSTGFKDSLMHAPEMCNNALRHIDWNRGLPYVWHKNDYNELINCNDLFARKFSSEVDRDIIDLIYNQLKGNEKA